MHLFVSVWVCVCVFVWMGMCVFVCVCVCVCQRERERERDRETEKENKPILYFVSFLRYCFLVFCFCIYSLIAQIPLVLVMYLKYVSKLIFDTWNFSEFHICGISLFFYIHYGIAHGIQLYKFHSFAWNVTGFFFT